MSVVHWDLYMEEILTPPLTPPSTPPLTPLPFPPALTPAPTPPLTPLPFLPPLTPLTPPLTPPLSPAPIILLAIRFSPISSPQISHFRKSVDFPIPIGIDYVKGQPSQLGTPHPNPHKRK